MRNVGSCPPARGDAAFRRGCGQIAPQEGPEFAGPHLPRIVASVISHPLFGMATLALILAGYFVVDGIAEIAFSFQLKPRTGWGWMLLGGMVSLLLGLSLWRQWPISGLWAIGILVGVKLIVAGWAMIALRAALESATCESEPAAPPA